MANINDIKAAKAFVTELDPKYKEKKLPFSPYTINEFGEAIANAAKANWTVYDFYFKWFLDLIARDEPFCEAFDLTRVYPYVTCVQRPLFENIAQQNKKNFSIVQNKTFTLDIIQTLVLDRYIDEYKIYKWDEQEAKNTLLKDDRLYDMIKSIIVGINDHGIEHLLSNEYVLGWYFIQIYNVGKTIGLKAKNHFGEVVMSLISTSFFAVPDSFAIADYLHDTLHYDPDEYKSDDEDECDDDENGDDEDEYNEDDDDNESIVKYDESEGMPHSDDPSIIEQ